MPNCPRCHQSISPQAVSCPYCRISVKAYGHPGIPLHRATGATPLCESCTYHADDTCTFPQRPNATECTLYQDYRSNLNSDHAPQSSFFSTARNWVRRNQTWLLLLGLLCVSFLVAL